MEVSDDIDVDLGDIEADMGDDIVVMEEEDTTQQQEPPQKVQEDSETSDESAPVKDEAKDTVAPSASESESDVVITKVSAQKNLKVPLKETTKPIIDVHPAFNGGGTGNPHFDELFGLGAASTIIEESSSESEDEQQGEEVKENGHHKKEHSSKSKKDSKKKDKKEKKNKKEKNASNGKSSSSLKSKSSSSRSKSNKSEAEQEPTKGARKRKQPAESVQQATDQTENHLKYDPLVLVSKRPKFKKRGTFAKELIKEKAWELTKQVCEKLSNENSKDPESHDTFNFMEAIKDCKTDEQSNRTIANIIYDFICWSEVIPPKNFNKVFTMPYNLSADPTEPSNFTQSQAFRNFTKLTYTIMAPDKESELKHHSKIKEEKVEPKEEKKPDLSNW